MVHPCIVSFSRVHSNSDGDHLAGPSTRGTRVVVAYEPAHNVGVVVFDATRRVVKYVEVEMEVFLPQQA
jgi:hypothetical protein